MISKRNEKQFDESQYKRLIKCSDQGDLNKWNEWRENNPKVSILLVGAHFISANLEGADLWNVNLEGAILRNVNLAGADLCNANLKSTVLWNTNLKGAELISANLADADLGNVNLEGADLWKANLKGAKLIAALMDRQTFIWGCDFNKQTVLTGKGQHLAKIEPRLKENIKINLS